MLNFPKVRTGTYYNRVQGGTYRYVPVRTAIYQVYKIPDDDITYYVIYDRKHDIIVQNYDIILVVNDIAYDIKYDMSYDIFSDIMVLI